MYKSNLFNKNFVPLFMVQGFAAFNDNLYRSILIIIIDYHLIQFHNIANPAILNALAAFIFIVPFLVMCALGGELADKYSKSSLIMILKSIEVIIIILGIIGILHLNPWIIFITLFLMGINSALFAPVKYAILPELVPANKLLNATALFSASTFICILLGTIFGGLGTLIPFWRNILLDIFFMIAILSIICSYLIPRTTAIVPKLKISSNLIWHTILLIKETTKNQQVFIAMIATSWVWFIGLSLQTQIPVLLTQSLHLPTIIITIQLCVFSIGFAIGSLLCSILSKGRLTYYFIPWAILAISIFMFDLCYAANTLITLHIPVMQHYLDIFNYGPLLRLLFDLFAIAVCAGIYVVPFMTVLETQQNIGFRSRFIASNNIMNAIFMIMSSISIIILTKFGWSLINIFTLISSVNIFFAGWIWRQLKYL